MLDNEFITLKYRYMSRFSESDKQYEELGIEDCSEKGHLSKYYKKKDILESYGYVYCPTYMKKDHYYLEGQYQAGFPVKRVIFEIGFCDQEHLNRIGSTKTCATRNQTLDWAKKLDVSGHYDKPYVNIDNIKTPKGKINTMDDIIKYQNVFLYWD